MKIKTQNRVLGIIAWTFMFIALGIEIFTIERYNQTAFASPDEAIRSIILFAFMALSLFIAWGVIMISSFILIGAIHPPVDKDISFSFQYTGKRKNKPIFRLWFLYLPLWKTQKNIEYINGEIITYSVKENYLGKYFTIKGDKAVLAT